MRESQPPTKNTPPSLLSIPLHLIHRKRLRAAVDDLAARLLAGDALYLHGWRGAGRSGVVGACLLAKLYG